MPAPATYTGNSAFLTPVRDHDGPSGMQFRLEPEFRIGGPPAGKRNKRLANAAVVAALGFGGWAAAEQPETITQWSTWVAAEVQAYLQPNASRATIADASLPLLQLLDTAAPAIERPETTIAAEPVTPATESESVEEPASAELIERLPPPVIDPADPLQARALAIGLHPGVSRALLAKLSAVDFENAAVAIRTALAETRDQDVLVWPRRQSPEHAQFKVKFATSAAPACRRYVVEIGKDGWMTTALPMEKCGIPKPRQATAARKKN